MLGPINRFRRICCLTLSEGKCEWLPKAATFPGFVRQCSVQRASRRQLSDARLAYRQSPVLPSDAWDTWGQAVVARFCMALQILPTVGGQFLFAVRLPACDRRAEPQPRGASSARCRSRSH